MDKKNSNAIYWSPKGRFVVVATVHNTQSSELEFYDLDFEGEKPEAEKDMTANLQLMNAADHYGVTDVEWDPSGRFVSSWASAWKHSVSIAPRTLLAEHLLTDGTCRWRMDTTSTISRESSCERNTSKSSSSGNGDLGL